MEAAEGRRKQSPQPCDHSEYCEDGEHHTTTGGTLHGGNQERANEGDEHTHLPEHLGGGDELCGGGLVWSIMGDDGHGNRQIRAGSQTCNDQADQQYGEVRGEHADDGTDGVEQVDPVEKQHAADLVGQAASEQRAEGDGEGQNTGKQADLRGIESKAFLPDHNGCRQTDDDAGSQHRSDACGEGERHVFAQSFALLG